MVLMVVVAILGFVALVIAALGFARIGKPRAELRSFERPGPLSDEEQRMRSTRAEHARRQLARPNLAAGEGEPASSPADELDKEDPGRWRAWLRSAMGGSGAAASEPTPTSLVGHLGAFLLQLTGIPLLASQHPDAAMGNSAKIPTPALRVIGTDDENNNLRSHAEVPQDRKAPAQAPAWSSPSSSEQENNSLEEEEADEGGDEGSYIDESSEEFSTEEEEEDFDSGCEEMKSAPCPPPAKTTPRLSVMLDGLVFYNAVATISLQTTKEALELAVLRATTILIHERRRPYTAASIQAIETRAPDIVCKDQNGDALMKPTPTMRSASTGPTSPRPLETRFLTAA